MLEAFRNNDPETRSQVAISSLLEKLEKSDERKEWVFVLKNLVVMDRSVEEHLMLPEISDYENPYLDHYQGTSSDSSQLINRLIQNYFTYIKNKAKVYRKGKSAVSAAKADRTALIERLTVPALFEEFNLCLTIESSILELNEAYKNGTKRPEIIQYAFGLLLSTLLCCHSIQYRCLGALIYKAATMEPQSLSRTRDEIERMDKSTTKSIMIFVDNNKEMECFKDVKYKEFFRFGPKFLGPIEELLKNSDSSSRNSRFSEDHLVVTLDQTDLAMSSSGASNPLFKRDTRRNKHFTAGAHRKDIHYTKNDDKNLFEEFQNGYAAMFSIAAPEMRDDKSMSLQKQSR